MATTEAQEQRRLYLRASVKVLVVIGVLFLLVPFLKSIPMTPDTLPANATALPAATFAEGETRLVTLVDGSTVLVTRSSATLGRQLAETPADRLWFPSAPGLATQDWFVLQPKSATDEAVRHLPAAGAWPGGFVADSGAAWDLAGRALKPWPGHPGQLARKEQNLLPLPWRLRDDQLVLVPAP
jgi:hypothetical protein